MLQTMFIGGQADVLRSEGETFCEKPRRAGVEVTALRIQGIIHDFVMLNSLYQTNTRAHGHRRVHRVDQLQKTIYFKKY